MTSNEIRQKFLKFFEKKGHTIVPSSPLIPTDPSVLFTTAGMQQFKPYFLGEKPSWGPNVASVQKCIRTSDIDEVGDETHLTFFEMLGNFSFGGYWKREAIEMAWEFLAEVFPQEIKNQKSKIKMTMQNAKLLVTVFGGDEEVPADEESYRIWRDEIGIPEAQIKKCGREDNFWGPTGAEGPCGPTTEIHYDGVEVWNLVFNEYYCRRPAEALAKEGDKDKKLTPLKQKGVDTGMGLERLTMVLQGKKDVFETDLFGPILDELAPSTSATGGSDPPVAERQRRRRIIADHIKGSVFLAAEGILPSNIERGYVLRRLLRRVIHLGKALELPSDFIFSLAQKVVEAYGDIYPELRARQPDIITVIQNEKEKFEQALAQGLKQFEKMVAGGNLDEGTFELYESYGMPWELIEELAIERGITVDKRKFEEAFKRHRKISAAGQEKKFGGHGLVLDTGELRAATEEEVQKVTRLHTATHLLQAALRQVLGPEVHQAGSDITAERTRFDFTFPRKLTAEELKQVEQLVTDKINQNLEVLMQEMPFEKARNEGALTVPTARYPENVKVYSINGPSVLRRGSAQASSGQAFSKEVCGGPHVENTGQVGGFRILKEESVASGIRRIRAALEN